MDCSETKHGLQQNRSFEYSYHVQVGTVGQARPATAADLPGYAEQRTDALQRGAARYSGRPAGCLSGGC